MKKRRRWHEILDRIPTDRDIAGAEIGVWRGDTAARILKYRPRATHHMIDAWTSYETLGQAITTSGISKQTQLDHNAAYEQAAERAKQYGRRARIWRMVSATAAVHFNPLSLDYVFIDAAHDYESVRADIGYWLPMIKPGGWIGGHDYGHKRYPGVAKAVSDYFAESDVETGDDYTWFVRIP